MEVGFPKDVALWKPYNPLKKCKNHFYADRF